LRLEEEEVERLRKACMEDESLVISEECLAALERYEKLMGRCLVVACNYDEFAVALGHRRSFWRHLYTSLTPAQETKLLFLHAQWAENPYPSLPPFSPASAFKRIAEAEDSTMGPTGSQRSKNSNNLHIQLNLSRALECEGDFSGALGVLDTLWNGWAHGSGEVAIVRGQLLARHGKAEESMEFLMKAVEVVADLGVNADHETTTPSPGIGGAVARLWDGIVSIAQQAIRPLQNVKKSKKAAIEANPSILLRSIELWDACVSNPRYSVHSAVWLRYAACMERLGGDVKHVLERGLGLKGYNEGGLAPIPPGEQVKSGGAPVLWTKYFAHVEAFGSADDILEAHTSAYYAAQRTEGEESTEAIASTVSGGKSLRDEGDSGLEPAKKKQHVG